jgi:hypothetical protein
MKNLKNFIRFAWRVIVVHSVSYFIFGLIMANLFNYKMIFQLNPISDFMKPIDSGFVFAGAFLQPIRGLIFAIALWPLWRFILEKRNGWLILWGLFLAFGIIGPPAAAPCSLEGIIYSKLPLWYHLLGLPEILSQTLCFSILLFMWERNEIKEIKPNHLKLMQIIQAIVISCFAYVGYAVGSLLSLGILLIESGQGIINNEGTASVMSANIEKAAGDFKIQLMFMVAFVINTCLVYLVSRIKGKRPISIWVVFIFFLVVDTFVPAVYQWFVLRGVPPVYISLLIGLFPAIIISLSLRTNSKLL